MHTSVFEDTAVEADGLTPIDYLVEAAEALPIDWKGKWTAGQDELLHAAFNTQALPVVDEISPVFIPERLKVGFDMLEMAGIGE
jgi:hypothetical protein